ncbi:MAG: DUF3105 domain-containing protein [Anaerolineae bacterium]|uniref:DUF3105 domain-containing protein n=1 Tax=Promineifilum sp. TaxID=2664178 RepID=UPI001D284A96|nr:DUF3105 domain-containing protein [Anaerolineales bacterium]MCB8936075.1 DUF3105 domain-containing protein [Promineifilum sp.]MCO5181695.1 DUF3105 domain-containing protein [Promineifilum sp.]MCW5847802.1 DUF3105 domain-containing protein [Anaerolineae bacterium]
MGSSRSRKKPAGKKSSKQAESSSNRTILIAATAIIGVAILGVLLYLGLRPEPEIEGVVTFARPSQGHELNLDIPYGELPPAGGVHDPVWQNCGIYDEPLNSAHAIHSMEHGALWVTYQPDLPADQIADIVEHFRGQTFTLISPYPEQRSPIVLTTWGVQMEVDDIADSRVDRFVERYRLGPNTPERGAACTNGIGDPIG